MTIIGHIAAGRLIGQQTDSHLAAFALGVAGHAAMDVCLPERVKRKNEREKSKASKKRKKD